MIIGILLHFADDEEHAKRAWQLMATWEQSHGWAVVEDCKKALSETREPKP